MSQAMLWPDYPWDFHTVCFIAIKCDAHPSGTGENPLGQSWKLTHFTNQIAMIHQTQVQNQWDFLGKLLHKYLFLEHLESQLGFAEPLGFVYVPTGQSAMAVESTRLQRSGWGFWSSTCWSLPPDWSWDSETTWRRNGGLWKEKFWLFWIKVFPKFGK